MKKCRSLFALIATFTAMLAGCAEYPPSKSEAAIDLFDVTPGAVTDTTMTLLVRATPYAEVGIGAECRQPGNIRCLQTNADGFFHLAIDELKPASPFTVKLYAHELVKTVDLKTAPAPQSKATFHFIYGGDLAGQNVCRDAERGFPIFKPMSESGAHLFIALGDIIYADGQCLRKGALGNRQVEGARSAARTLDEFEQRWNYSFGDSNFRMLRSVMAYEPVWDDHEVVNDFGPDRAPHPDEADSNLFETGRDAFFRFSPFEAPLKEANRIYRKLRWGKHAEVFLLDTRSYRDANTASDQANPLKTLLGDAQREWLIKSVQKSDATWKFVVSSVPISIPTGYPPENGRDGWASGDTDQGFENELSIIMKTWASHRVCNVVWLSADVHFATGFHLDEYKRRSGFPMYEFISGPLNAGIFPNDNIDPTFAPKRLFMHAPADSPKSFDEALRWFNYGDVRIDNAGDLQHRIVNALGDTVTQLSITPANCE